MRTLLFVLCYCLFSVFCATGGNVLPVPPLTVPVTVRPLSRSTQAEAGTGGTTLPTDTAASRPSESAEAGSKSPLEIDEQLYSRQLYVYGASAQRLLQESTVCIAGQSPLAAEVVKNLALGGVGKLLIYERSTSTYAATSSGGRGTEANCSEAYQNEPGIAPRRIQGSQTLAQYAQSLNPNIVVQDVSDSDDIFAVLHEQRVSIFAHVDGSFRDMRRWNDRCRAIGINTVSCRVLGASGLIFNDLLDNFYVTDADGEPSKEFPLSKLSVCAAESDTGVLNLEVQSIFEEKLTLGLNDQVEIRVMNLEQPVEDQVTATTFNATVTQVLGTHSARLSAAMEVNNKVQTAEQALGNGDRVSLLKLKNTLNLHHQPLTTQLRAPTFVPSNECLAVKQEKAISKLLLACFKAFDKFFFEGASKAPPDKQILTSLMFRSSVLAKLVGMGMRSPESPPKAGGVGLESLDRLSAKFFQASRRFGQCPATVSVIGALASQEVIKGCTHIHTPVSQFLMFECLEALDPQSSESYGTADGITVQQTIEDRADLISGKLTHTEAVYGKDMANMLAKMKVFVIGSGAIGCELLKTFALMGIGQSAHNTSTRNSSDSSTSSESESPMLQEIVSGGVVLTDMDHIERSNLNRQLLFRERHIGRSKSEVAAEAIKEINPNMNVKAVSKKVSPDTEEQFSDSFWRGIDIVATALDNVDARLYSDRQCVVHKKWLFDSGTLGTKGNVQVIVPFASESYSSSADPPDESIPMCTLKSFPYQSDHCIAWGRSLFDQLFVNDIRLVQQFLQIGGTSITSDTQLQSGIGKLTSAKSDDDIASALESTAQLPFTIESAVRWSLAVCKRLFHDDIAALLAKHPLDEVDDDGALFWSGSRRVPQKFTVSTMLRDASCRKFILQSAWLRSRLFGQCWSFDQLNEQLDVEATHATEETNNLQPIHQEHFTPVASIAHHISSFCSLHTPPAVDEITRGISTEEFEKDDLSLGHVDFVTCASNIRCKIYGLPEVSRLEVQKVAGRIVPALATTTAIVAGLVNLEILKLAGEALRLKDVTVSSDSGSDGGSSRQRQLDNSSDDDGQPAGFVGFFSQQQFVQTFERSGRSIVTRFVSRFQRTTFDIDDRDEEESEVETKEPNGSPYDTLVHKFHTQYLQNRNLNAKHLQVPSGAERIRSRDIFMGRFRNAFINVARPMLAFATPVEAEVFTAGDQSFTMWDTLSVPEEDISTLTVNKLKDFLAIKYRVVLQGLSMRDVLLYSDFMADYLHSDQQGNNLKEQVDLEDVSLRQLITDAIKRANDSVDEDVAESDRSRGDIGKSITSEELSAIFGAREFIDLDITCATSDAEESQDVKFPRLRIPINLNRADSFDSSEELSEQDFAADDLQD